MSFKSKIFAVSLVFSLGFFGPNSEISASGGEREGRCCGCWTGFVSGLGECWVFLTRAAVVIDDALDEVDDRLEQFQTQVTRLQRRINAFSNIVDLGENEHVVRILSGLDLVNRHIDMVQTLIGAVDDIVEDADDGISIQDVWTAIRSIRTSLVALHDADVINSGHVEGANARIDQVEDRIDGLEGFWNMGAAIVNSYRGFSTANSFADEDEIVIHISGSGSGSGDLDETIDI